MEVKPIADGYKKTVAGVIPNDWTVRHMGGVARVVSGQVDPRIEPYSLMPLVAPDHTESGTGRLARSIPTAREQRAISGKYLFRSGTVIYSKIRPHLRKVCIAPFDGLCSADMYPLMPADDVHPGFLFASLLSERFSKYAESVSIRSGMPKINREELASFEFVLPSTRQEQTQIAETLADADALIDSLEQLLTKKRQIKQGAMQELLTGKRRLPGFEQSWSEVRLGDVGRTYGGLTGKGKADFGHGASKYITFMNVMTTVRTSTEMVESVEVGVSESQNMVQPGDLLFNGSSETPEEVALCSWVESCDEGVFLNSFCFGFRPFTADRLSGLFIAYFFRGRPGRAAVSSLAQGATRYNIAKTALLQAPLRLPTFAEQQAIAEVLSSMDMEITALESRLTKAHALKQAMAQALLTGRIRLVEPTA